MQDPAAGVGVLAALYSAGLLGSRAPLPADSWPPGASCWAIWSGELFQLNIDAQRFLDRLGLNCFSEV